MRKSKAETAAPTLASYWSCPLAPEVSGSGQPLACIATTYTFDARFFETDLLPRFLGLRHDDADRDREGLFVIEREQALGTARVCVLVDAAKIDGAQTTLRWDQMPVRAPGGVQHSKVTLLAWERVIRVIVSSANLSRPGYRRNREIAGVLDFFDAPSSTPRSLALEVLTFLSAVGEMTAAPASARDRLRRSLETVRLRLRRWLQMPTRLHERKLPKIWFVPGLPERGGVSAVSALEQVRRLWGDRRASAITVMTPFVGDPRGSFAQIIKRLLAIPRRKDAEGSLVVPEGPRQEGARRKVVNLPRAFLAAWAKAWDTDDASVRTYMPPSKRDEDPGERALHAKALVLSSPQHTLLLCGSSNFSPHGMGIGRLSNVEANLCYLDGYDRRTGLHTRLPVLWDEDEVRTPHWLDVPVPSEEDPSPDQPIVPFAFQWATLDQRQRLLTLQLDTTKSLPTRWSVRLPRGAGPSAALFDHRRNTTLPRNGTLSVGLGNKVQPAMVTCLLVSWYEAGRREQTAPLPVLAASPDALLPPAQLAKLGADAIIAALVSGRDPVEWLVARAERAREHPKGDIEDPLTLIDTSDYSLYRLRRLGRALGTLGERLRNTARTEDAIRYRLFEDVAGPCGLTTAVDEDWRKEDVSTTVFSLVEIALTTAYAGAHSHADRGRGESDLRALYLLAVQRIANRALELSAGADTGPKLRRYAIEARSRCRALLKHGFGGSHAR